MVEGVETSAEIHATPGQEARQEPEERREVAAGFEPGGYHYLVGKIGERTVRLVEASELAASGIQAFLDFPRMNPYLRILYRMHTILGSKLAGPKTWLWKGFAGAFVGLAFPGPHAVYDLNKLKRLMVINQESSSDELEDSVEESCEWIVKNNVLVDVPEFHCPVYIDA